MEFFYCYGYGRLSREDYQRTGVRDESNSIKNQRDLIHKFVSERPELQLVMEGYDDGYRVMRLSVVEAVSLVSVSSTFSTLTT